MKLTKILDQLNSIEKNPFLKVVSDILQNDPKRSKQIDKILADPTKEIKNVDSIIISKVFSLIEEEFSDYVKEEFLKITSQLDILVDIIIRDGNCIMKQDWFARLYDAELKNIKKKIDVFKKNIESDKSLYEERRKRDYQIYKACLNTAFTNDRDSNQESKITSDELSILITLSNKLGLSQEEKKLINYTIIPLKKLEIDDVINQLKSLGIIFYSRKQNTVFVADEVVSILRKLRGKEIAEKYFRRVLNQLREPQLNLICRMHNLDWKLGFEEKIKDILNEGISFSDLLINEIFKENTTLTEKKNFLNEFTQKKLNISPQLKGVTVEDKVNNLIEYFNNLEQDEKLSIALEGYEQLLIDLGENFPKLNSILKDTFELQDENVLKSEYLLDYNIKPRDILDIIPSSILVDFCKAKEIKQRGNTIINILEAYKDVDNLFLENYVNIGYRDYNALKENGIRVKESEIGLKFEELTKNIFTNLGYNVNEKLRKELNTKKDKIDIVLSLDNGDIILVECKTIKESGYNKFSSVSRQMKSYFQLANGKGYHVIKSLLIAPEFSDDFVNECGLEYELNLSLITAESLLKIHNAFKNTDKHAQLPYKLLMRDVLIQEDRIIKAITK
jgi:hypothetical protein